MKTKNKKVIFALLFAFFIYLCFNTESFAGSQRWNALDYNVVVNADGSMDVVETWDISVSETNTLFKDFNLDSSKYSGITDVKVNRVDGLEEIPLIQIYEEQYHVDTGCYYALPIDGNKFEIAWNVGLDNSSATRTYKVYYKVKDAVKVYADCTELYWMFLGTENTVPGNNITGTIKLPNGGVSDIEKLRVWGHGQLNGDIQRTSVDTVSFTMDSLSSGSMLEIRVVTEENIYGSSMQVQDKAMLDSILKEEQAFADRANRQRFLMRLAFYAIGIVYLLVLLFFLKKLIKYIKAGKELKNKNAKNPLEIDYFREIPNEKEATPSRAGYLYYLTKNVSKMGDSGNLSKIFSATILNLALKRYIEFEPISKKNVKIRTLAIKENNPLLQEDEVIILDFINKVAGENGETTTEDLKKYASKHYDYFHRNITRLETLAKKYEETNGNISKEDEKLYQSWTGKFSGYLAGAVFLGCFTLIFGLPVVVELVLCAIACYRNAKKVNILTDKGKEEKSQWQGLKKYMEEFSLLKDKEVPDLILWEHFLVYATAFGISKKVLKQLKVVYPEMLREESFSNNYTYLYLASNSNFGDDFFGNMEQSFSSICTSAASAYSAAHNTSSGSGSGGGFSSGGGGRRRRGRGWRSLRMFLGVFRDTSKKHLK